MKNATYSHDEAAKFLKQHLGKSKKLWLNYLKNNPSTYRDQHGYKITCHVIDGQLAYTEAALLQFVKVAKTPHTTKECKDNLEAVTDDQLDDIANNLIEEGEAHGLDLKKEKGIDEACRLAAYYYKLNGFTFEQNKLKRLLRSKNQVLKELESM